MGDEQLLPNMWSHWRKLRRFACSFKVNVECFKLNINKCTLQSFINSIFNVGVPATIISKRMVENGKMLQLSAKTIYLKKQKKILIMNLQAYRFHVTQNENWHKKTTALTSNAWNLRKRSYKCYESNVYTNMYALLYISNHSGVEYFPWREGRWNQVLSHFGGRVKCFEEWRTAESSIIPLSLSCLVPARLSPVPEDVGVITGVERTCAPDMRDMSPRGRSPPVTSAGAPRWRRVIRLSLSARDIGLCAPCSKNKENMIRRCKVQYQRVKENFH